LGCVTGALDQPVPVKIFRDSKRTRLSFLNSAPESGHREFMGRSEAAVLDEQKMADVGRLISAAGKSA
jgi:ornithine carbamoyltransferase